MNHLQIQNFLDHILAYESGIRTDSFHWYIKHYNKPVIKFVIVDSPGRIRRNPTTGGPQFKMMTVQEYFHSLGVDHLFDRTQPSCIKAMQHSCINPWGFLGYQLGEMILFKTGYYLPKEAVLESDGGVCTTVPQIYVGEISNQKWINDNHQTPHKLACCAKNIVATDVNRWCGRFMGLNGVTNFQRFKDPELQTIVFLDTMLHNIYELIMLFKMDNGCFRQVLANLNNEMNHVPASLSGILACTHLRGARNTYDMIKNKLDSRDELNTSIYEYLDIFSGYQFFIDDIEFYTDFLKKLQLRHDKEGACHGIRRLL